MSAIEILREEHEVIKAALGVLEKMCRRLESGQAVDVDHLEKILEFIRVFVDKCHHGKEEDVLFLEMEKAGVSRRDEPIGVILMEHDLGRRIVKELTEAIKAYDAGDENAARRIVESARGYVNLINGHIYKEDNVLYPLAEKILSPEKQSELLEKFEEIEHEKVGVEVHEKFHALIRRLREFYSS
ncbi:MAG: hemerythrin domain-containing protein [Nitrososphaerota archaeon]